MALISKIAVQAFRTFSKGVVSSELSFHQNLSKLRDLLQRLTCGELNLDEALVRDHTRFDPDSGLAPVTFIDIWKDEHFSMSIFVLKPGTRLPLHDHPGMHGLIRVIHGRMNVFSYSLLERKSEAGSELLQNSRYWENCDTKIGDIYTAERLAGSSGEVIDVNSEPVMLTPSDGNIHEIRASDNPAAFFDILAPPYDDHRSGIHQCHYFKEIPGSAANISSGHADHKKMMCNLISIPAPLDYWTDHAPYQGPDFDPYDTFMTT